MKVIPQIALCSLLLLGACTADKKASITEGTTSMLTYDYSDPDPVAKPAQACYPYFRHDGYATEGKQKDWKSVVLENDWIQVTLFPEVGGKVWGAIDKTTGKQFVYYNDVVKFRDIAMRGPWCSGGIEFNFGIIGHVPTTAAPVDYMTRQNADGSASCFVASYELMTRTWWVVEVNVPADKAYFSTTTHYYNPSMLAQPYYQWMNAGFKAGDDMHFCAPAEKYIGHGGDAHAFPYDEKGHDLSLYAGNAFGADKSYHLLGEMGGFYGAWWENDNFGFVHSARMDEKLGKKVFLWAQSRKGAIWEDLLTDNSGQYVEMQAGRLFNQPGQEESILTPFKHHSFQPAQRDDWTEYWYPVEGIGPFCAASEVGALSFTKKADGSAEVAFSPVADGTKTVTIYRDGKVLREEDITFKALEPWKTTVAAGGEGFLRVVIGNEELVYDEDPTMRRTNRPYTMPADFDWNTAHGHCLRGEQYMDIAFYEKAENEFKAALAEDKYFAPALRGMASVCLHAGRYEEAYDYAKTALSINTYDGEANYQLGLAAKVLGKMTEAKAAFSIAAYTASVREAAYAALAGMCMADGEWANALLFASKGSSVACTSARITILRKMGDTKAAKELVDEAMETMPLYPPYMYEKTLLEGGDLNAFKAQLRCELPHEELMETALWYADCGQNEEAAALCALAEYPIATYMQAYLMNKCGNGEKAKALVAEANSASPELVFPFRAEMLRVLDWAYAQQPSWKLDYYRALILWHHADKDSALALLKKCSAADYAPLYLTRSLLENGEEKLADLKKAESLTRSWRTGNALIAYYMNAKEWDNACATAKQYFIDYPDKFEMGLNYAESLCEAGQYAESLDVLSKLQVMPKEGAYKGHVIYRRACLRKAVEELKAGEFEKSIQSVEDSKVWDERLGVGKPYDEEIDYTVENSIVEAAKKQQRTVPGLGTIN